MKKIFLAFLFCLISVHVFAQVSEADKINNEYYGLKWGCSVKDLKAKYPEAILMEQMIMEMNYII